MEAVLSHVVPVLTSAVGCVSSVLPDPINFATGFAGFVTVFVVTAVLGSGADGALSKDFPWQFRLAAQCR